jgi:autotransporter adhesin
MFRLWNRRGAQVATATAAAISAARQHRPTAIRAAAVLSGAIAALAFGTGPTIAGCNSGNVANTDLLSSANCQASATGGNAIALGLNAQATNLDSLAIGLNAEATGIGGIAIGSAILSQSATASGDDSVAIAANATASSNRAVAIGSGSSATGTSSLALGVGASAVQNSAIALGLNSNASNVDAVAIGTTSSANGTSSVAIGTNASAAAANSVAIGSGSTATAANTVSVGSAGNERRITNLAPGIASSDAATVGQLSAVSANFDSQFGILQSQINQMNQRVNVANAGVAMAMAMTGGFLPDRKTFAIAVNYGHFQHQNATAVSGYYRLSEAVVVSGGVSMGIEARQFGGRAGMLFAW